LRYLSNERYRVFLEVFVLLLVLSVVLFVLVLLIVLSVVVLVLLIVLVHCYRLLLIYMNSRFVHIITA
jgi:hypothetical protein